MPIKTKTTKAYGSITSKLYGDWRGDDTKFSAHDRFNNFLIPCSMSGDVFETAKQAFKENKRVSVYGQITYHHNGRPLSIDVKKIRTIKDSKYLPQMYDVLGILK